MPTRLRKIRKRRGSRTCGWGQIGQHRKHGAKGGRGRAGMHKHKWTWVLKYAPDYFGEKGFKPPTSRPAREINLNQLSALAEKLSRSPEARYEDGKLVIDLVRHGYDKVIATGRLSMPLKIIAKSWSRGAEEKITSQQSIIVKA